MYRSLVVGLTLLVLAAGCNAPVESTPESTLTPVAVPEAENEQVAPGELAPGVDSTGVTDAGRLAAAHADVLAGTTYSVNQTLAQTYRNGTVEARYVTRARFATDGRFVATLTQADRREGTLSVRRVERFSDGTRLYEADTEANETHYSVAPGTDGVPRSPGSAYPDNLTNSRAIAQLFSLVEANTTDQWVENGTRYYHLESRQQPPLADLPPLQNVTLTATVAETGLVTGYRVEYDVVRGGAVVHVLVAVDYRAVAETTVAPPAWLNRVNATG